MGSDWSNLRVMSDAANKLETRQKVIDVIPSVLEKLGYSQVSTFDDCQRVIVVCPISEDDWITVYDSSAYWTDFENLPFSFEESFKEADQFRDQISKEISPIIDFGVSDHACFSLQLIVNGQVVDQYKNNNFPMPWESVEQKMQWAGNSEIWHKYLDLDAQVAEEFQEALKLRESTIYFTEHFNRVLEVLNWNDEYHRWGYTLGADGIPYPYVDDGKAEELGYKELYFVKV